MMWRKILGFVVIVVVAHSLQAQVKIGETTLQGGGTYSVGYSGSYGDDIQSTHGLNFGFSNDVSGSFYNPDFLNFNTAFYYNQSRADSDYQSLTNASGVLGGVNLFSGSRFPGSVSYHYDRDNTSLNGVEGVPDFTSRGNGQGVGINWSALFPNWPTFSIGYQQGSGSSNVYGTDEESSTSQHILNLRSSYHFDGYRLNAFYDHNSINGSLPTFLTGVQNSNDSSGQDVGINAQKNMPFWNGSYSAGFTHSTYSNVFTNMVNEDATHSGYTNNMEMFSANLHPTQKMGLNINENYTSNLSAYLNQSLTQNNVNLTPVIDLGNGSNSFTVGAGLTYLINSNLSTAAELTHYQQTYFGHTYSGTFASGNLNYGRRILHLFTFSAGIVDSTTNFGNNNLGFTGTVNYFHPFGAFETSGSFSYAQNVQSVLITETNSYYTYNANVHRRWGPRFQWTASFSGSHSGLSTDSNASNSSESYSTSISLRKLAMTAQYTNGNGLSYFNGTSIVAAGALPGDLGLNAVLYNARSYGGSLSVNPIARLIITGVYSRALSDTTGYAIASRNNTEIITGQMQYRLRRVSLIAGYTRFSQGFTAIGPTSAPVTSYFAGISRWFNFF